MHAGVADAVNEAHSVAAKMVFGAGAEADEVGKAFEGLGKEMDKFGGTVSGLKKYLRNAVRLTTPKGEKQ
jgi:hypothetical protein